MQISFLGYYQYYTNNWMFRLRIIVTASIEHWVVVIIDCIAYSRPFERRKNAPTKRLRSVPFIGSNHPHNSLVPNDNSRWKHVFERVKDHEWFAVYATRTTIPQAWMRSFSRARHDDKPPLWGDLPVVGSTTSRPIRTPPGTSLHVTRCRFACWALSARVGTHRFGFLNLHDECYKLEINPADDGWCQVGGAMVDWCVNAAVSRCSDEKRKEAAFCGTCCVKLQICTRRVCWFDDANKTEQRTRVGSLP